MRIPYVMDDRFFVVSLVLVGLLALFGVLLLPLLFIVILVVFYFYRENKNNMKENE